MTNNIRYLVNYRGMARMGEEAFVLLFEVVPHELGDDPEADCAFTPVMVHATFGNIGYDSWVIQLGREFVDLKGGTPAFEAFDLLFTADMRHGLWADGSDGLSEAGVEQVLGAMKLALAEGVILCDPDDYPFLHIGGEAG